MGSSLWGRKELDTTEQLSRDRRRVWPNYTQPLKGKLLNMHFLSSSKVFKYTQRNQSWMTPLNNHPSDPRVISFRHICFIYPLSGLPRWRWWSRTPANARDTEMQAQCLGREIPWRGCGNPLQCSCLENPTGRGTWRATVHASKRAGHNWVTWHARTHPLSTFLLLTFALAF